MAKNSKKTSKQIDVKVSKRAGKAVLGGRAAAAKGKTNGKATPKAKAKPAPKATPKEKPQPERSVLAEIAQRTKPLPCPKGGLASNGVVIARAGTGKTFTQVTAVANMYRDQIWGQVVQRLGFDPEPSEQQQEIWDFIGQEKARSIVYVAFNKSIVTEFSEKYKWLIELLSRIGVHFQFSTIHSMANSVTGRHYRFGWQGTNNYHVRNLIEQHWQTQEWFRGKTIDNDMPKEKWGVLFATESLVSLCKLTMTYEEHGNKLAVSNQSLDDLAARYGIDCNGHNQEVFELVNVVLNKCRHPDQTGLRQFDFDDQIWLPLINDLQIPQYDLLLVDEGQDLNRCQQEFVLRAGRRIVLVGDDRQAIYGFAGADTDSIPRMTEMLGGAWDDSIRSYQDGGPELAGRGCEVLRLTQTRRCGKAIVEAAKEYVPDFEAYEKNGKGKISDMTYAEAWDKYETGDMVLCRTNAPLIRVAFGLLREGRQANIQGRDISTNLKRFIKQSKQTTVDGLLEWMVGYEEKEVERLQKRAARNPSAEDQIVALVDKLHCIRIFCDGAISLDDVYHNMDKVLSEYELDENGKPKVEWKDGKKVKVRRPKGVLLSSVHRAKGLEAGRVFILKPELMPHPMAKTPEAKAQEINLKYVAITRAIDELVWVRGEPTDRDE